MTAAKYASWAVADGWAMVRRPGCVPFVLYVKDIAAALAGERPGFGEGSVKPEWGRFR